MSNKIFYKNHIALLLLSVLIILASSCQINTLSDQSQDYSFTQNKKLGRGVNIIGYDPIWQSRDRARFKEHYFQMIKDAGFSTVRINLHAFRHMDRNNDYKLTDSWWEVLNWAVDNAIKSDLMVILDMHEYGSMGRNPENGKQALLAFWTQVSERFKNAPDNVIFEILNEPSKQLTPELWNQYLKEALAIIRQTNPNRMVIIGPGNYNQINYLDQLELPEEDRNIIVTIHYYSPMEFTHQGAAWAAEQKNLSGVEWTGTEQEKAAIRDDFAIAKKWAQEHNRPVFVGEFGAYDKAPMESRLRYLNFMTRTMEEFGFSWAYWQFDSDFIVYDINNEKWVESILNALIPKG